MDWDLARTLLAISRALTLSAAARDLGVNQTTISRRLEAAEKKLGAAVFLRLNGQLVPTDVGEQVLAQARIMETAASALLRVAQDAETELSGPVEITATDGLNSWVVAPLLADLQRLYPQVTTVLSSSHQSFDLSRRQADIALRLARPQVARSQDGVLRARKLADLAHAVYRRHLPQDSTADPADHAPLPWLAYDESFDDLPESQWLRGHLLGQRPIMRTNSLAALCSATSSGLGQALLPCYAGDQDPLLCRQGDVVVWRELWLVVHQEVARVPRVRAVADWLTDQILAQRHRFAGLSEPLAAEVPF